MAGPWPEAHATVQRSALSDTGLTHRFAEGQLSSAPQLIVFWRLENR